MKQSVLTVIQETIILGKQVKLYRDIENPLFEASDIANWLDIQNVSQMLKQADVPESEKGIFLKYTLGGNQNSLFITEDAMYDVLMSSRKKEAKPFRREIKAYLKQIRQTGGYIPIYEEEPNEVFLARAVQIANETIKHKDEIIATQKKRIESLEETEKDWKLLMDCKGTFSVNEIAHFIGIGEYKLFARMREVGILFKNENGDNVPYEKPVHKGKFISIPAIAPDGSAHLQTRVYPEGISYITKLLRKYGYLEVA